ncbi:hypothetical protein D3C72_1895940 [compost metagenome]
MATKWVHQTVAPPATAPRKIQAARAPARVLRTRFNRLMVIQLPSTQTSAARATSARLWAVAKQSTIRMKSERRTRQGGSGV